MVWSAGRTVGVGTACVAAEAAGGDTATGAGPAVFGLFHHKDRARAAQRALKAAGESWLTAPAWYG